MQLVRAWARRATTAAGASLALPMVIMAAAALVALGGGGVSGLGALTQLVEGPDAPLGDLATTLDSLAETPGPLGGDETSGGGVPADGGGGDAGGSDGGAGGSPGGGDGGGGGGGDGGGGGGGGGDDNGGGGGGEGGAPGGGDDGPGPGGPTVDPVEEIGETGREISEQLPPPVGPLTGEVLEGTIDTVEQLVPGLEITLPPAPDGPPGG